MLKGINHDVVEFVMARRQDSGGFGFVPSLPASVEDTYHAIRILQAIMPLSEKDYLGLKTDPKLKAFLMMRKEDKDAWSLETAYQYLALCRLSGVTPDQDWQNRFLAKKLKVEPPLRGRYFLAKILRECSPSSFGIETDGGAQHDAPPMEHARLRADKQYEWSTAEELWMCLYIHEGSPRPLNKTKEELIQWLQACQTPDGGFGFFPGTTSFIENTHWCLRTLVLLGGAPLHPDMARNFILKCKTRGGGFARKSGGAPFLYATWHAIACLSLLQ